MDGKIKVTATGRYRYTSHVLSVKLFAQYLRMQLKNDFCTFNIGRPCKQYNFQMRLHDNLVPRMLEMAFQSLTAPCSYSRLLFSNQLPTSNFIETPAQTFTDRQDCLWEFLINTYANESLIPRQGYCAILWHCI